METLVYVLQLMFTKRRSVGLNSNY